MKQTPRVTIIVTAYNMAAYLPATLQSVLNQTETAWELIIVDDGSTKDATPALIDEWTGRDARIRAVHQKNGGVSRARNTGLRLVSLDSPFVLFLDGDDILLPNALKTLAKALEDNPEAVAAHGRAQLIDGDGRPADDGRRDRRLTLQDGVAAQAPLTAPTESLMMVVENCVSAPGLLLARTAAMNAIGGFDEALRSAEDYDCWFRLIRGSRFVYVNEDTLQYRRHPASKSKRKFLVRTNLARLKRKWLRIGSPAEQDLVRQGHAACIRFYAREKLQAVSTDMARSGLPGLARTVSAASWHFLTSLPKAPDLLLRFKIWYYGNKSEHTA